MAKIDTSIWAWTIMQGRSTWGLWPYENKADADKLASETDGAMVVLTYSNSDSP